MADRLMSVFLAVGSNIEPEEHIPAALRRLGRSERVTGISTFYCTAAIGRPEQPAFLNGVWRIETTTAPRALKFDVLRSIEAELGRIRDRDKYAPRTIDLDILLYGDLVMVEADLRIPDPDLRSRPFLAVPLLELVPNLVLPDTGEPLSAIVKGQDISELEPAEAFTEHLRGLELLESLIADDLGHRQPPVGPTR